MAENKNEEISPYNVINSGLDTETSRRIAYTQFADPIFFQWQRGEKTEQEWRDVVKAIQDANPYPEVTE